jgi:hypothetical protein
MSNKIIISKSNRNALTETDPNKLVFSSDYGSLKYYRSGSIILNWVDDGTLYTKTVAHGLGYVPFFIAYVQFAGSTTLHAVTPDNQQTVAGRNYRNVYADKDNIIFAVQQSQGTGLSHSIGFYYKIFKNDLGF